MQRKLRFEPPPHDVADADFVARTLKSRKEILPEKADRDFVADDLDAGWVRKRLGELAATAVDYGKFDLRHDQDVAILFHQLRAGVDEAAAAKVKEGADDLAAYLGKSTEPVWTYDLALLGTGAAVAYYIASHKDEIDYKQTVVIGHEQPWAGERGAKGAINHPLHMITALREAVGLGTEALTSREEFSRIVKRVIAESVCHQRDAQIKKVRKVAMGGVSFYKIEVGDYEGGDAAFYAKRVVAGLGIGGHILPKSEGGEAQKPLASGHAMNMDEFQRDAEKIRATVKEGSEITVAITGPNAGIDVVTTSLRLGFKIIWVTGSQRPGFLPGTDNEEAEREYDLWMKEATRARSRLEKVITKRGYEAVDRENRKEGEKPIVVKTGDGDQDADYYVWAMGPDVDKVKSIFDQLDALELAYDENRQFGDGSAAALGLRARPGDSESDQTSLEVIGGAAYRMAYDPVAKTGAPYTYVRDQQKLAQQALEDLPRLQSAFAEKGRDLEEAPRIVAAMQRLQATAEERMAGWARALERIEAAKGADGLPAIDALYDGRDLQLVGSLHPGRRLSDDDPARHAQRHWGTVRQIRAYGLLLEAFSREVKDFFDAKKAPPQDPRLAWGAMAKVIKSLPLNVAVNDQLTPSRSQVEASAAFVPGYVQHDVNFATDSATVLQIHIAVNYPNLTPEQANMWVERIIAFRRPPKVGGDKDYKLWGPIPNPSGEWREDARTFDRWFKKRLSEENLAAKSHM